MCSRSSLLGIFVAGVGQVVVVHRCSSHEVLRRSFWVRREHGWSTNAGHSPRTERRPQSWRRLGAFARSVPRSLDVRPNERRILDLSRTDLALSPDAPGASGPTVPVVEMKPDLEEFGEGCCPSCGTELVDEELTRPVCSCCAKRLERELAAYLEFVALSREPA